MGKCTCEVVVTGRRVSWKVWIFYFALSSTTLLRVCWRGGFFSHILLLWPARLSFRLEFLFCKVRTPTDWSFGKIIEGSTFLHFFSWGSSGTLLCTSCLVGFKSVKKFRVFPIQYLRHCSWEVFLPLNSSLICASWGGPNLSHRMPYV